MNRQNHSGFTIIELMLTITIGAILLAFAVPSYTNMVLNNCLTSKANSLVGALQLARSTAITFREDVSVGSISCRIDETNNGSGNGTCDSSDDFGEGVVVFRDIDDDGLADEIVEDLNGNGALDPGEDINGNGILDIEILKRIRFTCDATMDETTEAGVDTTNNSTVLVYSQNGGATPRATINICDSRDSSDYSGRRISLSATGRPITNNTFTCP